MYISVCVCVCVCVCIRVCIRVCLYGFICMDGLGGETWLYFSLV